MIVVWQFLKKIPSGLWWVLSGVSATLLAVFLIETRRDREERWRLQQEKAKAEADAKAAREQANAASATKAAAMIASGNYVSEVKAVEEKVAEKQAIIEEKKAALPSTNASAEEVADAWNKRTGG